MLFAYSVRSIWARRFSTIAPILVNAVAIGGAACSAAYLQGFADVLSSTSKRIAVIAAPSAVNELQSEMTREQVLRAAGLAPDTGRGKPSADLVVELPCNSTSARYRGVAANAAETHGGVRVAAGTFENGTRGVLVGAKLAKTQPTLTPPHSVRIGDVELPILAVLDAPGTPYESEIWMSYPTLLELQHSAIYSTLRLPLADESQLASLREGLKRMFFGAFDASTERDFFERIFTRQDKDSHVALLLLMMVLLVGAGAVSNLNTMYAVALSRRHEFFTLSLLGFRRARIVGFVLQESILVNLLGGLIGLVTAHALVQGQGIEIAETGVLATARFSPEVITAGIALSLAIGVFGGGLAGIQVVRLRGGDE